MTVKNKILLSVGIASLTGTFAVAVGQGTWGINKLSKQTKASDSPYTLVLNSANAPEQLTSSYEDNVTTVVSTQLDNEVYLNIVNGKTSANNYVDLASRGMIYNFKNATGQIAGISGISVTTSSGSVSLRTSPFSLDGGAFLGDEVSLSNSIEYVLPSPAKYFQIIAGSNGAIISSVTINYVCDESHSNITFANGTYVGKGNNNITYKMVINNGVTTIESLDNATPENYSGTTSLLENQNLSTSFSYGGNTIEYITSVSSNGQILTPQSTGGFPSTSFYRVYNVDDFESYSATGQGYTNATTKYQTSGLRANYFSDYSVGTGGNSPIGGSAWSISTSSDFMNYTANGGRNGSKGAILKGSTNGIRFISMNSLYGLNAAIGKGAVLSFWAHGPYKTSSLAEEATFDAHIKAYAFYNSKVNSSNITQREELEFTLSAHSGWMEYKLPLESNRTYYGFGFYTKPESQCYIAIDDISIYTHSPYVQPLEENFPDGTYATTFQIKSAWSQAGNVWIMIAIGGRIGDVYLIESYKTLHATSISFDHQTNQITINTTGYLKYGDNQYNTTKITATYDKQNHQLKSVRFMNGNNNTTNVQNNGNITMNFTSYFDGLNDETANLRNKYTRRYNPGSWQVDNSNADRIVKDVVNYVGGTGALKIRGYSGGLVGLVLTNDLTPTAYKNFGFWVYNPSNTDITGRIFVYKGAGLTSNSELSGFTAKAGQWTYYHGGFDATIYNFQIAYQNATYLTFDNISFC